MRRGELLALRWSEVDLERRVIAVERSVTQIRQERVYVAPKNHERREVNIARELSTPSRPGARSRLPSA
jgi:integrase